MSTTDSRETQLTSKAEHEQGQSSSFHFNGDNPANPSNWSLTKKILVLSSVTNAINNANIGSSIATSVDSISKAFGTTNKIVLVLPTSMYMLGYVIGPTIAGPLSEFHGRRIVLTVSFAFYVLFSLVCIFSPNITSLIVLRLLMGMSAAVPLSIIGGTCADLFPDPLHRGRGLAYFITAAGFGPALGPIIAGYNANRSWKLPFWINFSIGLASMVLLFLTPETLKPEILRRKMELARKQQLGPIDHSEKQPDSNIWRRMNELCTRAPRMFLTEPLVFFSCVYMALVYGIFYVFFQAYHKVYEDGYGMSPGEAGLTFLALGIGGVIGFIIYLYYDQYLRKQDSRGLINPLRREEILRLPLACIASPLLVLSLFWIGASASRPHVVHWSIPVLGLIPFGAGYMLIFVAFMNYLVDSYAQYAASALAAATATRSLMAAVLPLGSGALYERLGLQWGFFLLAFLMVALGTVSYVFWLYGHRIRQKSRFCQELASGKKNSSKASQATSCSSSV